MVSDDCYVQMTFMIDRDVADWLKKQATRRGISVSRLLRELISEGRRSQRRKQNG